MIARMASMVTQILSTSVVDYEEVADAAEVSPLEAMVAAMEMALEEDMQQEEEVVVAMVEMVP